jgi:hypothetical protein
MAATSVRDSSRDARQRERRVFITSFAQVILLLAQYVLGLAYNLYGTAPTAAKKVKLFSSPLLAAHVVLGTLLILVATYLAVASIRARARLVGTASIIGLACLVGAWICGDTFAQNGANGYSMAMGVLTAAALLCYTAVLMVLGARKKAAEGPFAGR